MNWMELLQQIFELCIVPLLAILTKFLVDGIKTYCQEKIDTTHNEKERKYISMLETTITNCVIATNQTYVNVLKDQNAFDLMAQKIAFQKTYQSVMAALSEEAKTYLKNIFGDLEEYITDRIEAEVYLNK